MAVSTKTIETKDIRSGRSGLPTREVHYIKIGKGNRKGAAAAIGGELFDHLGAREGDFHIVLVTKVNGRVRTLRVKEGDVVFRTDFHKRWQVITKAGFKKRFPESKI